MTDGRCQNPAQVPPASASARARGPIVAIAVFVALMARQCRHRHGPLSYFEVSFMSSGGATLALAAIGQTIVILSGGFDLSAGAVISLVNVVLSTSMQDTPSSIVLWSLAGIGVGVLTGAFNGFFIAVLRLQPIVVTLSTMFIVQGLTLLVMDNPGGMIPGGLSSIARRRCDPQPAADAAASSWASWCSSGFG